MLVGGMEVDRALQLTMAFECIAEAEDFSVESVYFFLGY